MLHAINFVVELVLVTFVFTLMFRYVPESRLPWKRLWVGAAFTAILFNIGTFLIGIYLGKAAVGSAYGPPDPSW